MLLKKPIRFIKQNVKRMTQYVKPRAVILMYHRISDVSAEPHWLAVSPGNFARHLEHIRRAYNPVRLAELVNSVRNNSIRPYSVAVTFDDGYQDNLTQAVPLLETHGVPATVFVTAGHLGSPDEFWWDELQFLMILSAQTPPWLSLEINSQSHSWNTSSLNERLTVYLELNDLMKPLSRDNKEAILEKLRDWAGTKRALRPDYRTVTVDELKQLAQSRYVDLGAHTMTHAMLPSLSSDEQYSEITESGRYLESILGQPVDLFAYPYGDFAAETAKIVEAAGFKAACTTIHGCVHSGDNLFQLKRWAVNDWDIETFQRNLVSFFHASD